MYNPKRLKKENPYDGKLIFIKKVAIMTTLSMAAGMLLLTACFMVFPKQEKNLEKSEIARLEELEQSGEIMIINEPVIEEPTKKTEEEILIDFYSEIYGLDSKKVYEILSHKTLDFKDPNYVNYYIIGDSTMKGRPITCTNKEMAILIAVRSIYFLPEEYEITREELETDFVYESELDYSHQIAYICNVVGVDPALHYAICRAECSFNSPMFLNKHNPSGIKFDGEYVRFPSFMAGFIEQALELLKYQIDGKTTIEEIGSRHAPTEGGENLDWVSNVTSIYKQAMEEYETLFGFEERGKVLEY